MSHVLTLNRPRKLNALDGELRGAMLEAILSVRSDDDGRAVIVTGTGRGFCSGADLTGGGGGEPKPPTQNDHLDDLGWVGRQALAVYGLDKPVIGAVNGVAAPGDAARNAGGWSARVPECRPRSVWAKLGALDRTG